MTRLVGVLRIPGLDGDSSLAGRLIKLQRKRCPVYLVESRGGAATTREGKQAAEREETRSAHHHERASPG